MIFHKINVSLLPHFFNGDFGVPQTDLFVFVFVQSRIGQRRFLVSFERQNRRVHHLRVKDADADKQFEIGDRQAGHFTE